MTLEMNGFVVDALSRVWKGYDLAAHVRVRPESLSSEIGDEFQGLVKRTRAWLRNMKRTKKTVAVWGASHQALTLLAECRAETLVSIIIDSAPFKQGKLAPVTHIPVVPPRSLEESPVDSILVMAAGYSDEVVRRLRDTHEFTGSVFVLRGQEIESVP